MTDGVDKSDRIYRQDHDFPEGVYRVHHADADSEKRDGTANGASTKKRRRAPPAPTLSEEDDLALRDNVHLSPEAADMLRGETSPQDAEQEKSAPSPPPPDPEHAEQDTRSTDVDANHPPTTDHIDLIA